jgi:hypothetical protein
VQPLRRRAKLPVPQQISGLKAWFDSRNEALSWFAFGSGTQISGWLSRAGSMGSIAWSQSTAANQATWQSSVATFNGQPAVYFDGVNRWFDGPNQTAWTFLHNGTGSSIFHILRIDSSLAADMYFFATRYPPAAPTEVGMSDWLFYMPPTAPGLAVANGTAALLNNWNPGAAFGTRDVTRWIMSGYVAGTRHARISGSALTNPDAAGSPSSANTGRIPRLGAAPATGGFPYKGWVAQQIHYDHILTAPELTSLVNYFAPIYGIAA